MLWLISISVHFVSFDATTTDLLDDQVLLFGLLILSQRQISSSNDNASKRDPNDSSAPPALLNLQRLILAQNLHRIFQERITHPTPSSSAGNQDLEAGHELLEIQILQTDVVHDAQVVVVGCDDGIGEGGADEKKLEESVVFAQSCGMYFGGGEGEVPVPPEGLGGREGRVAPVDRCCCEGGVAA